MKMYTTVTVGTKWQVVIPQEVRERLNIRPWDSLMVVTKHGKAIGMIKTDDMAEFMAYMQNEIQH
jgi:AbrB family looped-hinge helix DNA binding protein